MLCLNLSDLALYTEKGGRSHKIILYKSTLHIDLI
uniref:Uncharacterized protein n=1 Tax=Siphoviridae sp. cthae16 TaxID=2825617 RepID=A0A8S5URL5_9CAUD|nr:MAG TPA: hypothetical protein [Siphoviridae sp. cthae16]